MFSNTGNLLLKNNHTQAALAFNFGIEVEMDRADTKGKLSQFPYPQGIGESTKNPWITNDFLEVMTESVTPAADSAEHALYYLSRINTALHNALHPGELLWPLSMPPILPVDRGKQLVATATPYKHKFFRDWVDKHSFFGGTPCGIHVNMSIKDDLLDFIASKQSQSRDDIQTHLYLKIGQGFFRYRWLITYLFGASPIVEANYYESDDHPDHPVRSLRQSNQFGYGVTFTADFTNLDTYVDTLKQAYQDKILLIQTEGHGPVRYRGKKDLDEFKQDGIKYVEMRMLDLDPTSSVGIKEETLRFFRLLAAYFIMTPAINPQDVNTTLDHATEMNNTVALERPTENHYQKEALALIDQLQLFTNHIEAGAEFQDILQTMRNRITHPELTPSAQLTNHIQNDSLVEYALKQANQFHQNAQQALNPFTGFNRNEPISAKELKEGLDQH